MRKPVRKLTNDDIVAITACLASLESLDLASLHASRQIAQALEQAVAELYQNPI